MDNEGNKLTLDSFEGWDSNPSEIDFFGVKQEAIPEDAQPARRVQEKVMEKKGEKEGSVSEKEDSIEEEQKAELFQGGVEDLDDEDLDNAAPMASGVGSTVNFIKRLRDRKILSLKDDQMPKNEREAREQLEDYMALSVENRVEEMINEVPEVVQNLIKFTLNGGDAHQFINDIVNNRPKVLSANMDLSDPRNQELVIRTQLYADGYDDDFVDTQIDFLKDNGRMELTAKAHYKRWEKMEEARHQQMAKQQREAVQAEKERRRKLRNEVHEMVATKEAIGGVKLTPKDKKHLPDYMTDRKVQLKNGQIVTEMQRDLIEVLSNDEKAILLAKLLSSGFDLKEVEMMITTKVTDQIKQDVRRTQNLAMPTSSGSGTGSRRSLADMFSD